MENNLRASINAILKETFFPILRSHGFIGSIPHFRRLTNSSVDLLTFQFDKWGGGFYVEVACGSTDGLKMPWGEHISAQRLTVNHFPPNRRKRIHPNSKQGVDTGFRFDDGDVIQCVQELLGQLPAAESWWCDQV